MSSFIFNPKIASCLDSIVKKESGGWPLSDIISLKYLTSDGNQLFNKAGEYVTSDSRFIFKLLPVDCINDQGEIRVLQMLESSILDVVLHLPVLDKPSNLWALGWNPDFKWSETLPPRCAFDFAELLNIIVLSIFEADTGDYKSFHHSWVRSYNHLILLDKKPLLNQF